MFYSFAQFVKLRLLIYRFKSYSYVLHSYMLHSRELHSYMLHSREFYFLSRSLAFNAYIFAFAIYVLNFSFKS